MMKRGGQVLAGLLADFSEVEKAMTNMTNAYGSADREMAIIQDSMEYHLNTLKQEWVGIVQELIDRGTINDIIDLLTKISDLIGDVVDQVGILGTAITSVVAILAIKGRKNILESLKGFIASGWVDKASISAESAAMAYAELGKSGEYAATGVSEVGVVSAATGAAEDVATGKTWSFSAALKSVNWSLVGTGGLIALLAGLVAVLYETGRATDDLVDKAGDLGETYRDSESDIESYKKQIGDLYKQINDSNTSLEDAKTARENLLGIQDELIDKYGKEEGAIKNITDAIYGNVEALNYLDDQQYEKLLRDMEVVDGNIFQKAGHGLNRLFRGVGSEKSAFMDYMGGVGVQLDLGDLKGVDQSLIDKYGLKRLQNNVVELGGNIYDAKKKLEAFYREAEASGASEKALRAINVEIAKLEENINKSGNTFDAIVLREQVLNKYADTYAEEYYNAFKEAGDNYRKAFTEGNKELLESSAEELGNIYLNVLDQYNIDDKLSEQEANVLAFFRNMFPELEQIVLKPSLDRLIDETAKQDLTNRIAAFGSEEALVASKGTQAYEALAGEAAKYGVELQTLIEYLREIGLLSDFGYVDSRALGEKYYNNVERESSGAEITDLINKDGEINAFSKAVKGLDSETQQILTLISDDEWEQFDKDLLNQYHATSLTEIGTENLSNALSGLAEKYRKLHPEIEKDSEELDEWGAYLAKTLEKIGMSDSDFDTYVEVLKRTNPELADNQELAEKTALANQLFSNSVKDLQSNLDTYVEALSDTTKKTPEYNDAIVKLSDHLRNLTGINFSITDTEAFISDQKNLEDLKKAIEGDDEALHRLQETAAESIYIEVDDADLQWLENRLNEISSEANISIPADISSDGLVDDFNALIDWLNTADLGSIEAQTYLNTNPFMQALQALAAQSEETANAIAAMFQNKGIDAQVTYTTVNMPDIGNPAKQIGTIPTNVAQLMNYNLSHGKLSKKYVNASANGIVYGTTPMQVPSISFNSTVGGKRVSPTYKQTPKHISAPSSSKKGGGGGGGGGGKGGPSSDSENSANEQEDTYDELFDYFERRLDVLNNAAELLDKNLENVVGSMAKNTLLDAKGGILKEQMNNYEDALNMYQQKADEAFNKLPADIQARIKDGAVALTEFIGQGNEEVVEAMNDYKNWADKVDDVKQNLAELKETLRQLELQKFNNIVEDFTQQFDLRQSNGIDLIKDQIALFEEAGQVIGEAFYTTQKSETEKLLSLLSDEKNALTNQFNEAIRNGVEIGSDEYLEMVNALTDVDSKILEAKTSLEEFDNAILQLHVDMFERVQTTFSNYHDELEDIRSLIESADEDVATKDNAWTSTGLAQLGTLAQQYEMASYQVRQYDDEIALLNQQYLENKYSTKEYADRLAELMSAQRDAAMKVEDYKDAMIDLNKARVDIVVEGINEEIEAYEKLNRATLDSLNAQKD